MPFSILEKAICYTTFVTKEESSDRLKRCSRCRCAWYKSLEEQRANWPVHKEVCKRPDYETIGKFNASECMQHLQRGTFIRGCDHNTAAVFERLFDIIRHDSDTWTGRGDSDSNIELAGVLHAFSRVNTHDNEQDSLEPCYRRIWACPGMPQFLHFTDIRSSSLRKMMTSYPEGRPLFDNEKKENNFDLKYDTELDESGEHAAWFIIGFLVRSCVWGKLHIDSNHDGRGHLRDTYYAAAAQHHLAYIFSTKSHRECAKKALYPVPGFILNIAENKEEEFLELLDMGIGPGVIEWADLDYGKDILRIMSTLNLEELFDDVKLDIMEICCNIFGKHAQLPWFSTDETQDKVLIKLCSKIAVNLITSCCDLKELLRWGMNRRPEILGPQFIDNHRDRRRIVIAFLYEKFVSGIDLSKDKIVKLLQQFGNMEMWERTKFAKQVMEVENFDYYKKQADELRGDLKNKLKGKFKKKTVEERYEEKLPFPFPFAGIRGASVRR